MKLFSLENSLKYLFLLLPITIITGPFLADANCSLLALLFLINSFKKSLKYYYINKIGPIELNNFEFKEKLSYGDKIINWLNARTFL